MIINRTLEYRRNLRKRDTLFIPLTLDTLKAKFISIKSLISELEYKQEKNSLPSFKPRNRRQQELQATKDSISAAIADIESDINNIGVHGLTNAFIVEIQGWFRGLLKDVIVDYRKVQQTFLTKIDIIEDFESMEENELGCIVIDNAKYIRKSIYELTTILLQMKQVVVSQTHAIDRLDCYYDTINYNLEGTNAEIEKFPKKTLSIKDRFIYVLMCVLVVLIVLSLIKVRKSKW